MSCLPRPPSSVGTGMGGQWPFSALRTLVCDSDSALLNPQAGARRRNHHHGPCARQRPILHPLSCPLHEAAQTSWTHFLDEDTEVQSGEKYQLSFCAELFPCLHHTAFMSLSLAQGRPRGSGREMIYIDWHRQEKVHLGFESRVDPTLYSSCSQTLLP